MIWVTHVSPVPFLNQCQVRGSCAWLNKAWRWNASVQPNWCLLHDADFTFGREYCSTVLSSQTKLVLFVQHISVLTRLLFTFNFTLYMYIAWYAPGWRDPLRSRDFHFVASAWWFSQHASLHCFRGIKEGVSTYVQCNLSCFTFFTFLFLHL